MSQEIADVEERKSLEVDRHNWLGEDDHDKKNFGLIVESRDRSDLKVGKDQQ